MKPAKQTAQEITLAISQLRRASNGISDTIIADNIDGPGTVRRQIINANDLIRVACSVLLSAKEQLEESARNKAGT